MTQKNITIPKLVGRVKSRLRYCNDNRPPFTLVMGSGFSFPLIPTTRRIVRENLPWWILCNSGQDSGLQPSDFANPEKENENRSRTDAFASQLWKDVKSSRLGNDIKLANDGLPTNECIAEAYKCVLSAECNCGLNTPDEVRRYFAAIVSRIGRKINPAHLYLASLIAEPSRLFGTIFTTNFDPLLQRAMQMLSVPYFVSDRPDTMQHPDDDDAVSALHLVYAHGSIYRYMLLNSPDQIEEYARRNQSLLQEYFRKHAVLIIGYSGWDDAITRALRSVVQFDHNLYWCDRGATFESSGLSPIAQDILRKHSNAFYVPIESADQLMLDLHQSITGHTLPQLFREPIVVMMKELEACDLTTMRMSRAPVFMEGDAESVTALELRQEIIAHSAIDAMDFSPQAEFAPGTASELLDLGEEVNRILRRLDGADRFFRGVADGASEPTALLKAKVHETLAMANDMYFSKKYLDVIPHYEFIEKHSEVLDASEKALAMFRLAVCYGTRKQAGDLEREIVGYTTVINMDNISAEQRAKAYLNRSITYGQRMGTGDFERKVADCTAIIELPDVPSEQTAKAIVVRGIAYLRRGEAGDFEQAIADCTAVIEMPNAPEDQRAFSYFGRASAYGMRNKTGDADRAIADYSAAIEFHDLATGVKASALLNRGLMYNKRKGSGDLERAIADYSAILEINEVSIEQSAKVHICRAVSYVHRNKAGDLERAIKDFSAVIEIQAVPDENLARAKFLRGLTYCQRQDGSDFELAKADFAAVIGIEGAPAELRASAQKELRSMEEQSE